jgi:expansin (peptidoglycan-binding protein)
VVVTLSLVDLPPTFVRHYSRIERPFTHILADQNGNAGACGNVHSDQDLIGAIDISWYGNTGAVSQYCGRSVQVTNLNNGKSVNIVVADVCPTCDTSNSFDLSVGAFSAIAALSDGEVPITWSFT